MSKVVSQLDPEGFFVGATAADESPLEAGVFLLPSGCVDYAPPDVPHGMQARLVNTSWVFSAVPASATEQPLMPPELPTVEGQIKELLNSHDVSRREIQTIIALAELDAKVTFMVSGTSIESTLGAALSTDKAYKFARMLEDACVAIEQAHLVCDT